MKCPLCPDSVLEVTYHGGIEVDICPTCRGVWLDRGELDRLVADSAPRRAVAAGGGGRPPVLDTDDEWDDDPRQRSSSKKRRKKSFAERLGDVFEEVLDF